MKKSVVALVKCMSYDPAEVSKATDKGLELLGGLSLYVRKNESIVVKPNLLSAHPPEKGVTTHPEVFRAVCEKLQRNGVKVSYGDSASLGQFGDIVERTGLKKVAEELRIPTANFINGRSVYYNGGEQRRQFTIALGVLDADGLISLPKLKTHNLTRITGAIKNQFGCVPGFLKPEFHVKLPSVVEFSKMLVDLNGLLKPRLFIMDAIQAMQGNGPSSGTLYPLHLLMFSTDPVAIDSVACLILHVNPEFVFTNWFGEQFGLGKMKEEDIEIVGDDIVEFLAPDFEVQRTPEVKINTAWKYRFAKNWVTVRPAIDHRKCINCGICVNQCPVTPKALMWRNKDCSHPPVYSYHRCIRCFCCQEACPQGAIYSKRPRLRRIIDWAYQKGVI